MGIEVELMGHLPLLGPMAQISTGPVISRLIIGQFPSNFAWRFLLGIEVYLMGHLPFLGPMAQMSTGPVISWLFIGRFP